jgi:hypothetical protein
LLIVARGWGRSGLSVSGRIGSRGFYRRSGWRSLTKFGRLFLRDRQGPVRK